MSSTKSTVSYRDFTGGMFDEQNVANLKPNELPFMQNVDPLSRGGYEQRKGCEVAYTLSRPIKRMLFFKGTAYAILDNNSMVEWDGTVVTTALNSYDISYTVFKDTLYILDGTNFWSFDGSTLTSVTGKGGMNIDHIRRCKYIYKRGARLFFAGDPQNLNLVWFSGIGDATDVAFGNSVQAVTETSDYITGLFEYSKHLLVYQKKTLYGWSGWDPAVDVQFNKLPVHSGTPAGRTVVDGESMAIYYGIDSIYGLLSTSDSQINSDNIAEGMMNILKTVTHPWRAVGVQYKGKYLLAVCTDGTGNNNMVLVGHTTLAKTSWPNRVTVPWSIYTGWQVNDWYINVDGYLYFAGQDNKVYRAFQTNSDAGVAIDTKVIHKLDLNKMFNRKKVKTMVMALRQYVELSCTIHLKISIDYRSYEFDISTDESLVYGEGVWNETLWGWVDSVVKEIRLRVGGSFMEIELTHKAVDEPMAVYGFAFYVKTKSRPKGVNLGVYNS